MRKAFMDLEIIKENDRIIAISLGHDACAEHEIGASGIRHILGMDEEKDGFDHYRVTEAGFENLHKFTVSQKGEKFFAIRTLAKGSSEDLRSYARGVNIPSRFDRLPYTSVWDYKGFQVISKDPEIVAFLEDWMAAAATGGAGVMPFRGSMGVYLSMVIFDRLPEALDAEIRVKMAEARKLKEEFEAYDFEARLRAVGVRYVMLSPRRLTPEQMAKGETKIPMSIWANCDFQALKRGWYTVEKLEAFIHEKEAATAA